MRSRAGKSRFCSLWLPNPKAAVIMFQEITSSANSLGLLREGWRQRLLMPRKPTEQIRKAYLKSYLGSKFTTTSPVYSSATLAFPGISFFNVWLNKPGIETVMLDKVFYRVYHLIRDVVSISHLINTRSPSIFTLLRDGAARITKNPEQQQHC